MRTIYQILAEMERNSFVDMELTEDLSSFLTILSTFNDHVKPFKNLQIETDNERYLNELKNRIGYFLTRNRQQGTEDSHTLFLRKITLVLVYNTDTDGNHVTASGTRINHLVDIFPRISKCVLFYLLKELHLHRYFLEFIQYGATELVIHFLDSELLNSVKSVDKEQRLEIVPQLISAIYHHCWLACFDGQPTSAQREDEFESINDFMATLLLAHFDANRELFPELKKKLDYDTYVGQLLRHHLRVIVLCLETYLSKSVGPPLDRELFPLFQIDNGREWRVEYAPDEFTKTFIASLNNRLLNRLQLVLMTVSCNTFMNWVEVDLSKTVTLQRAVGELAHRLFTILTENIDQVGHDVGQVLKEVAVKPRNAGEMAKEANIAEIIDHIEDKENGERRVWMKEFLNRGLFVLDNEECLTVISDNIDLLSIKDLEILTEFLKDNVGNELSCLPQIVEIILNVLPLANNAHEVEDFLEKEEPFKILLDYDLASEKYFQSLTEFLNKLVDMKEKKATLSSIGPFIRALTIDPKRAIVAVQNNCISDANQVENGLEMLEVLKDFVAGFMDEVVKELLEDHSGDSVGNGFESYVVELFIREFLDKEEFLKESLFLEIIKRSQEKEKSMDTLRLLNILKDILASGKCDLSYDLRAPFVVGIGQVADEHRWDLMSYSDTEEKIVALSVELIGLIGMWKEKPMEGKHKSFVLHKCQTLKEMNRYYVEKLFPENTPTDFVRFLHAAPFPTEKSRRDFLCKVFVRATAEEKEWLSDCEELQPHFVDMMLTITKAIVGQEKLQIGFRAAFAGFLKIFKEKLLEKLSQGNSIRFLDIVSIVPADIYSDQSFVINSVIVTILERTEDGQQEEEVQRKISQFPESSGKAHLLTLIKD